MTRSYGSLLFHIQHTLTTSLANNTLRFHVCRLDMARIVATVSNSRGNLSHVSGGANPSRIVYRASFEVSSQLRASNITFEVADNIICLDNSYEGASSWAAAI